MGNLKNKIIGIVIISTITLATGCGITITRTQYFVGTEKIDTPFAKKENNNINQASALKNMKNGQNR